MNKSSYNPHLINSDLCITQIIGMVQNYNPTADWTYEMSVPQYYSSLLYVIEGSALFYMNEKKYQPSKGMVVFRKQGDSFHSRGLQKPFHYIEVVFDIENNLNDCYEFQYLYQVARPDFFYGLFLELQNVWNNRIPAYQIKAKSLLLNIFYHLITDNVLDKEKSKYYKIIEKSISYMQKNYFNAFLNIELISKQSDITSSHFRNLFKKIYGVSPLHYITVIRIEKAKNLLTLTNKSVKSIASQVGINDIYHFSKLFKKMTGLSPSHYRNLNSSHTNFLSE